MPRDNLDASPAAKSFQVARGRTVWTGDAANPVITGPGETVVLCAADAAHLMAAGFLVDPELEQTGLAGLDRPVVENVEPSAALVEKPGGWPGTPTSRGAAL